MTGLLAVAASVIVSVGGALVVAQQPPAPQPPAPQTKGRLFPPTLLGLLEAPDRERWQKPDLIMDALGIADGAVVAEIGAAGGWFTVRLARRVGPNGIVYAEDIQPLMIEALTRRLEQERITNVRPILGTANDPLLPGPVDSALIVWVYHEMDDPLTLLKNLARTLRRDGRIGIVDFTAGGGGPGPAANERVEPERIIATALAAGLVLRSQDLVPPFQFLLVFGKA